MDVRIVWAIRAAVIGTIITIILVLLEPWRLFSKRTAQGQKNRYLVKKAYDAFALKIYRVMRKFPPTYLYILNLGATLKYRYMLEETDSHVQAVSLVLKAIGIGIIGTVSMLIYFNGDTLLAIVSAIMITMYGYQKLMGDGQRFLEELEEIIGDIVHIYNAEGRNIDRMFNRILKDNDSYMYLYLDNMYTYLKKALLDPDNSQLIIAEYNRLVPSRHLRLVFNYIYITARYGDEEDINGEQLFNKNLLYIQREVHADLTRMIQIKEATFGEQVFIILAVVMIPVATQYMEDYFSFEGFESITRFLHSSFGYTIKLVCAFVAFVTFFIYQKLVASNIAFESFTAVKWSEHVMKKYPWVKDLLDWLAPEPGTERRKNLEDKIIMAEGYVGVRPLYLKKLLTAIVVSLGVSIFLVTDTFVMYDSINGDIYKGVDASLMDTVLKLESYPEEFKQQSLSNDDIVVKILKENKKEYFELKTVDEQKGYISKIIMNEGLDYGGYPEVAVDRIHEKFVQLNQITPTLLVAVFIVVFFVAYMIPNISMQMSIWLNQGAVIYNEAMGCYTVVILLINHSASNIYMILNWLVSFARVFKGRLQQCIDNLSEKEIRELERGVNYKPFSRLVECILLAYNGADLQSAFAGIEQRHMFQEDARKLLNEQIIKRRIMWSQVLSWCALGCTFILYIVAPMLLSIVEMLQQLV